MNKLYKSFKLFTGRLSLTIIALLLSLSSFATIHNVTVSDFQFTPASFNVVVGDTIVWTWTSGSSAHTTTSTTIPSGATPWNSPLQSSNPAFAYIVTVAGNYNYVCQPHSGLMTGTFTASTPVGITPKPGSKELGVSIYPNPVERFVTIELKNVLKTSKQVKIEVYDIIGNQYHNQEYRATKDDMKIVIDLEKLNSGFGFINIITNDRKQIFRIIKEQPTSSTQKKIISLST